MDKKESAFSLLDGLAIAAPCTVSWDSMSGDDRVRHCSGCSKNVYNISDMTRNEANEFLRINGSTPCMTFYRRKDGTILTDNCPVGLRKLRDRYMRIKQIVAGFIAFVLSAPQTFAQEAPVNPATKGSAPSRGQPVPFTHKIAVPGMIMIAKPQPAPNLLGGKPSFHLNGHKDGSIGDRNTGEKGPGKGNVKLHAEINVKADSRAYNFYLQAKEAEADDDVVMASFFYKKALAAFDLQGDKGDPKFRELIVHDQCNLTKKDPKGATTSTKSGKNKSENAVLVTPK